MSPISLLLLCYSIRTIDARLFATKEDGKKSRNDIHTTNSMDSALIQFTYSYPKGSPLGCCGGYYDDPSLNILNSSDGSDPEDYPTKTNSIEWTGPSGHSLDHDPLLDLGEPHIITEVKVSYIVRDSWGKYAPKNITIKGSLIHPNNALMEYDASLNDGFPTSNGGYTVSVPTLSWDIVQYIELSQVIPYGGHSLISNMAVFGEKVENIALQGTALQSSSTHGGTAERAIDGNTSGEWSDGSITHTDVEDKAWWKVDLNSFAMIKKVVVWNRMDCCSERLSNSNVDVLDSEGNIIATEQIGDASNKKAITLDFGNVIGFAVRIQLQGSNYLSLAEVQVFPASAWVNESPTVSDDYGDNICIDKPQGWYDNDGKKYTCDWYAMDDNCAHHGDIHENMGKVANKACCVCGGGKEITKEPRYFPIWNPTSDMVVDIPGGNCDAGTNVIVSKYHGGDNQLFYHGPNDAIISKKCNMALDVWGNTCENGGNLIIWQAHGGLDQVFEVNGDGSIVNPVCDKAIDMSPNSAEGSLANMWDYHGSWNQVWTTAIFADVLLYLQDVGDKTYSLGQWAGTKGQNHRLEGFEIKIGDISLEYMAHLQGIGDTDWTSAFVGSRREDRRLEGFAIRVIGEGAEKWSVQYAAHLQGIGDTLTVSDGIFCGTRGESRGIEAVFVNVVPKIPFVDGDNDTLEEGLFRRDDHDCNTFNNFKIMDSGTNVCISGYIELIETECKAFAECSALKYKWGLHHDSYPKGCYVKNGVEVYFNNSPGSASAERAPICGPELLSNNYCHNTLVNFYNQHPIDETNMPPISEDDDDSADYHDELRRRRSVLPSNFDLRNEKYLCGDSKTHTSIMGKVWLQNSCGSCMSMAYSTVIGSTFRKRYGMVDDMFIVYPIGREESEWISGDEIIVSPGYLGYCLVNCYCNTESVNTGIDSVRCVENIQNPGAYGKNLRGKWVSLENSSNSYDDYKSNYHIDCELRYVRKGLQIQVDNYIKINLNKEGGIELAKQHLLDVGPLVAFFRDWNPIIEWDQATRADDKNVQQCVSSVIDDTYPPPAQSEPGHAVTIIGWETYGHNGNEAWIIQNSHGNGFGQEGYFKVKIGYVGQSPLPGGMNQFVYGVKLSGKCRYVDENGKEFEHDCADLSYECYDDDF